jgi:hypothetical protein
VKASRGSSNLLIGILATVLIIMVIGVIAILAVQYNLLNQAPPTAAIARPVLVTRVVQGTDLTRRAFPTLPPAWTFTPSPTTSPTQPTATASLTEAPTITPTFPPTDTPIPTQPGPTRTRRPTLTPFPTLTGTPGPAATLKSTPGPSPTLGQD